MAAVNIHFTDSNSSYLVPVYTAEKRVRLDICEACLDLATQPLLGILLGPKQLVRNRTRSNTILQQCKIILYNLASSGVNAGNCLFDSTLQYVDGNKKYCFFKLYFRCHTNLKRFAEQTVSWPNTRMYVLTVVLGLCSFHRNNYGNVTKRQSPCESMDSGALMYQCNTETSHTNVHTHRTLLQKHETMKCIIIQVLSTENTKFYTCFTQNRKD